MIIKSESCCSYEDLYSGRLRRPIYPEQISRNGISFDFWGPTPWYSTPPKWFTGNKCVYFLWKYHVSLSLIGHHASVQQDYDWSFVYNSCQILEWFNQCSDELPQAFASLAASCTTLSIPGVNNIISMPLIQLQNIFSTPHRSDKLSCSLSKLEEFPPAPIEFLINSNYPKGSIS